VTIQFDPADIAECRRIAAVWAPTLRALANVDRLLIVLWLAGGSRSVRELEAATGLSQSLVSYHLRGLSDAGLVTASAEGRSNRYRLRRADLDQVASLMGSLDSAAGDAKETSAPR
jgi:DNA-binding transcriptional ArsR family regulator